MLLSLHVSGNPGQSWILDSTLWIPDSRYWSGFHYLSVERRFWIPIVSGIPDFLSCIPDSKTYDSGFHKQNVPGLRNTDSLTWGDCSVLIGCLPSNFPGNPVGK